MELTPALRDLYDDRHPFVVVQKGAQVGISEWMVNQALWAADTNLGGRGNVLYVMPTEGVMRDFTQARVDRAIADSDYLAGRVHPEPPQRTVDRTGLKKIGSGHVYFRGADHRQLSSVDADLVVVDEFDLMDEHVLALVQQRIGSSRTGWIRVASTPRHPEAGINRLFLRSDQRRYLVPCAGCGTEQHLTMENVDTERAMLVCRYCGDPLDLWAEGRWEATAPGNTAIHGYQLSRLYSPLANIEQIIRESEAPTPIEEQQFQNQVLGEVYLSTSGGLTPHTLDACRQSYRLSDYKGQLCHMGIDVGKVLHVVIREAADPWRLWNVADVDDFASLDPLMKAFQVQRCVIDSLPEMHAAANFVLAHPEAWLADYGRTAPGHDAVRGSHRDPNRIHVNRTEALEGVTFRFVQRALALPAEARQLGGATRDGLGGYYQQLLSTARTLEQDAAGNWAPRWLKPSRPDHYLHAELYCMVAEDASSGGIIGRIVTV
jgi:hypothetical protein